MAIKKIQMRPEGTNDYADVLHPETSADMVKFADGTTVESHKAGYEQHTPYAIATGTNSYAVNIDGVTSLVEGMSVKVKFTSANTGACTLNINGLSAKEIRKSNGNSLSAGNIKAGQICHLVYTGSVFQLLGEGGEYGTVQPEHVLEGYTIGTEEGIKSGTMPNRGAVIIIPSTTNQTILNGYHNGSGYVKGDSNLVAGNIKEGINIFGVTGSLPDGTGKTPYLITSATIPSGSLPQSVTIPNVNFTPSKIFVRFYGDISLAGWGVSVDFPLFTNVNEFYARVIAPGYGAWLSYIYATYSKNGSNVTLTVNYRGDLPAITSRGSSQIYIYGN